VVRENFCDVIGLRHLFAFFEDFERYPDLTTVDSHVALYPRHPTGCAGVCLGNPFGSTWGVPAHGLRPSPMIEHRERTSRNCFRRLTESIALDSLFIRPQNQLLPGSFLRKAGSSLIWLLATSKNPQYDFGRRGRLARWECGARMAREPTTRCGALWLNCG